MGSVSVTSASVMTTGQVTPAAAPWELLPVWQQTSSCVTTEGCVSAAYVSVIRHTAAQPAGPALLV